MNDHEFQKLNTTLKYAELSPTQLTELVSTVVGLRDDARARAKESLRVGDRVRWQSAHQHGMIEGRVERVMRKNARVRALDGTAWVVGMALLERKDG